MYILGILVIQNRSLQLLVCIAFHTEHRHGSLKEKKKEKRKVGKKESKRKKERKKERWNKKRKNLAPSTKGFCWEGF